jgi:hypothetical protein
VGKDTSRNRASLLSQGYGSPGEINSDEINLKGLNG